MLEEKTIHELHILLKKKEIRPQEILEDTLEQIGKAEERTKAYITLTKQEALSQAQEAEKRLIKGKNISPLTGIPLAIKDNICTEGIKTTCASKILSNFIPPYDATVIKHLKKAGVVILGKTNMDEFAMGSSTENSAIQVTKNPWDSKRVPGGSSGGSAAAVAANECISALGSDTGGSIRQPASFCGVVGLKPTYGLISRFGLIAFASSLDQIGPLSKDVTDAAILLSVIAKHDDNDSTSAHIRDKDYTQNLQAKIKGHCIGLVKETLTEGLDEDVKKVIEESTRLFTDLGAEVIEVSLPHLEYAVAVYYIVAPAEASSNLARYDGIKYGWRDKAARTLVEMYSQTRSQGFGSEVKRRIMLGTYALSSGYYEAYYKKASQVRTLIKEDFIEAFTKCDLLITPVAPTPAFKIGEKIDDPLQMYLSDIFTIPINLAGLPAISIPAGFSQQGLPIGLQIIGPHFSELKLLQTAYQFEQALGLKRKPKLF
jgi:aspartyl-tRNA(Asn)/glutamyl-tRNA(Gln) amidotransferase subunit A